MWSLMYKEDDKDLDMSAVSEVQLSKVVLDKPYDAKSFCSNQNYCGKDQDFEMRMRSLASNELLCSGLHKL